MVLWKGDVGGAEMLDARLAERLRGLGAEVTIVFIGTPWPLGERLSRMDVPFRTLGFTRGREVVWHQRRYAREVTRVGPDGVLLVDRGFIGSALRLGGYPGPIVAVEHGSLLYDREGRRDLRHGLRQISRVIGAWHTDEEVAVSDFMLAQMRRHGRRTGIRRIYNGIDPNTYRPLAKRVGDPDEELVIGFVGRLVPGKGLNDLIRALAVAEDVRVRLLVAGDGPDRASLESLARELRADSNVEFVGLVDDVVTFWQRCDIAAVPSNTFESFSMTTLEAMACGKPIVATRVGAIPELVVDGASGTLVQPGDAAALARGIERYVRSPELRDEHGSAARARAIAHFDIDVCARAYLDLFGELAARSSRKRARRTGAGTR